MKILGIDIGFSQCGLCFLDKDNVESYMLTANTGKPTKSKQLPFLKEIFFDNREKRDMLINYIYLADLVCIEKPFNIKGFGTALYELLGIIKYICIDYKTQFCEIPQTTLKKMATGKGNAKKSEMVMKAYKEFGHEAGSEDEIDAFWVAIAGDILLSGNKSMGFSKARMDSLKKLEIQG